MNRRDFVNWMGVGAISVSLPVAIAACHPTSEPSTNTESANTEAAKDATSSEGPPGEFVAVGTTADLAQQGYVANAEALGVPVIVIEDPASPDGLIALSSTCTHNGCTVAWQEDLFACPCHGSKFNPDGSVVEGPASAPLPKYAAKIEGNSILVAAV